LILKEEKCFPKLIFINDAQRSDIYPGKRSNSLIIKIITKLLFIKKINLIQEDLFIDNKDLENKTRSIQNIYENNIAMETCSLMNSLNKKVPLKLKYLLYKAYLRGKFISKNNTKTKSFIFNGRIAPIFMFFEGLSQYSIVKRIELRYKNNKRHVYASSGYIWKIDGIYQVEKEYQFDKDLLFFEDRKNGIDFEGKRFVKNRNSEIKYKNIDILMLLSTPYEYIGFSYTPREVINLFKYAFREIIKFNKLGYKCVIRNHPNFISSNDTDKKLFKKWFGYLSSLGIIISDFDEKVSSYNIADNSKLILTIGSTIGGELSFANKVVFDLNKKSVPILFKVVNKYKYKHVIDFLENKEKNDKFLDFKKNDYVRFSGYFKGYGTKIPEFLNLGLNLK